MVQQASVPNRFRLTPETHKRFASRPALLSCGGQRSKPVKERFLLRCKFVVGDQPIVSNLLEPLQLPFERRILVSGRSRSLIVTTVYRGSAQGKLLIGES